MAAQLPCVWASHGAPFGPSACDAHVAAVNSYAAYVYPPREQYFYARSTGPAVSVFHGRQEHMATLTPHGTVQVACVALAYESASGDMLLAAGAGTRVVVWRLKAAAPPHVQQVPVYSGWALDSTLDAGAQVYSVALGARLAVGTLHGVAVYGRDVSWRPTWRTASPRGILAVRWSHDEQLLAAVPQHDTRIAVWKTHTFALAARIAHTRAVQSFAWRSPSEQGAGHAHVLATTTTDGVVRFFSTFPDAPLAFRMVAAVDAATEGDELPCRMLSTVYIDAWSAHAASRGDLHAIEQQKQNAAAGVGTLDEGAACRARRLTQLLQMPDFVLAVLADSSLAVYTVGPFDANEPTLVRTHLVLRLPLCVPPDAARTRMHLDFLPLPPGPAAGPGALVHAQALSGAHGSLAVSLGYLFDGDLRGVVVQHHGAQLLCSAHAQPVVSLAARGTRVCSLSSDGHVIVWSGSLASLQSTTVPGAQAAYATEQGTTVVTDELVERYAASDARRTFRATLAGRVLALGGSDVAVCATTTGIYGAYGTHRATFDAAAVAPDGRVYTMHAGVLAEWAPEHGWHTTACVAASGASRMAAHGRCVAAVHQGRVTAWDMAQHEFCTSTILEADAADTAPLCWIAGTQFLAVGAGSEIDLYARTAGRLAHMGRVGVPGVREITHMAALDDTLVIAHGCSISVHTLSRLPPSMRPLDDATHLWYTLQVGAVDAADATLRTLAVQSRARRCVTLDDVPLDTLLRRSSTKRSTRECEEHVRAALADSPERLRVAEAVWDVQRTALDPAAMRCIAAMRAAPGAPSTLWGEFSESREALVSAARLLHERFTWEAARCTGAVFWAPESLLAELLEQAARTAFAGESPDVVLATTLYLALGRLDTVRAIWRRAIGNSDRQKMMAFLANDFGVDRWRIAAQKNAFALLSQRRFAFAAAFFLLGGAHYDAVSVCIRQLRDMHFAVAIARICGGEVLARLLRQHVLPTAVARADRLLACWALHALGREHDIPKMIVMPLAALVADESFGLTCEAPANDVQDPSIAPLLEHARARGWSTLDGALESRFVLHIARQLTLLGCPVVGLALVRGWQFTHAPAPKAPTKAADTPAAPTKIGSLLGTRAPPPAQSMQEFDMGAFGL